MSETKESWQIRHDAMSTTTMRRIAMRTPAARTIGVGCGEYDGELCDMVSAALRVTETPGSLRILSDEYDVNEDAGGEDDSE